MRLNDWRLKDSQLNDWQLEDWRLKHWLQHMGRTATIAALLLAAIAATAADRPSPWSWSTEKIDSSGIYPSMVIDAHDDIHLAYVTLGSPEKLVYAYRPSDTKQWFKFPITYGRATTALALDSKGHPNIVYELADGQLWFTSFNGKTWVPPSQISPEFGKIEYSCTIAMDGANRPHLFWYQVTHGGSDYYHLRHAELSKGTWQASTLDDARETGKWHSAISGPNGDVYVVYSAFPDAQLKLAHYDGKDWSFEVVDSRPPTQTKNIHPIFGGSIALDSTGAPMISYEDENRIKFAHKVNGKWAIEEVDPILPFVNRDKWWELKTSLAIDSSGMAHIVYTDAGAVKHAYQQDGKWHVETLVGSGADSSRFPQLVAGHSGNLYLVYRDPDDGALMLAIGRPFETAPAATEAAAGTGSASSNGTSDADFPDLSTDKGQLLDEYRRSADQGSTGAQRFLGFSYLQGKDVPKDPTKAAKWFRKAADEGDVAAQTALAWMYLTGFGVPQDNSEALRWIRLATQRNFAPAQELLGFMYATGRGVARNDEEAVKWYKLSADQGYTMGQLQLGLAYLYGRGVSKDDIEALSWLQKAAEQGNAMAELFVGDMYKIGDGVSQNDVEAVRWFQKGVAQGFAPAEGELGWMLMQGRGIKKNEVEGISWLRKAAAQGESHAQYQLGEYYRLGIGVKHDPAKAKELYCATAQVGYPRAMNACGIMTFTGVPGARPDIVESLKWLTLAVAHTAPGKVHDSAVGNLARVRAAATPEQVSEATRRADNFRPHVPAVNPAAGSSQRGGK